MPLEEFISAARNVAFSLGLKDDRTHAEETVYVMACSALAMLVTFDEAGIE